MQINCEIKSFRTLHIQNIRDLILKSEDIGLVAKVCSFTVSVKNIYVI